MRVRRNAPQTELVETSPSPRRSQRERSSSRPRKRGEGADAPRKNICCVGDDDQSIYGWRGAEVDNILRFDHDFPGAKVIRLERNYRSTGHILAAASHLIAHNEGRLGKTLRTEDDDGEKVTVTGSWDSEEEARGIGEEIEQLQRAGRQAQRDRDPGARLLPDARVRRPLRHARPALSRDRRPALLRARRNPRRAGLSARHQFAGRRSRLRAHRQCAQARPRRRHRADAARPRPQAPHPAVRGGARGGRDRRAEAEGARILARRRRPVRPLARAARGHRAYRSRPDRARRERLYRDVAEGPLGRCRGPAGEPERAGALDGGVREPARVSWSTSRW